MYEGVPGSSSLDFSQSHQIALLEIAIAMLELPKR